MQNLLEFEDLTYFLDLCLAFMIKFSIPNALRQNLDAIIEGERIKYEHG